MVADLSLETHKEHAADIIHSSPIILCGYFEYTVFIQFLLLHYNFANLFQSISLILLLYANNTVKIIIDMNVFITSGVLHAIEE